MIILLCLCFLSSFANGLEPEELFNELSWTLKLKLLDIMYQMTKPHGDDNQAHKESLNGPAQKTPTRRVGVEAFSFNSDEDIIKRRQSATSVPSTPDITADENNMRLKLFRLMYETVRDSDLKVKRAELIQDHYSNMTTFQIGYLMGDVTDKFSIMTDISTTLTRFYKEWKPIEHINAYEQIANQAIEISHLIDLIRLASKRDTTSPVPPPRRRSL